MAKKSAVSQYLAQIKREGDNDNDENQFDRKQNRNAADEQHVEDSRHNQHGQRGKHDRAQAANDSTGDAQPRGRIEFRGQNGSEYESAEQRAAQRDDHGDDMDEQHGEAETKHQAPLVSLRVASEQA